MTVAEMLRQEFRFAEGKVNEFFARQIPMEMFRYTLSQMRTIRMLYNLTVDAPAGVQLKMLAEKLHVTPAAASEMVDTLVRKGAILREGDPADRRAVLLRLSGPLQERFEECERQLCLLTGRFLETLDPAEVDVVLKAARLFSEFVSDDANFPGNPRR